MQRDRKRTYHLLAVFRVRKADADWLVNEEDVGVVVPGIFEALSRVPGRGHSAWACPIIEYHHGPSKLGAANGPSSMKSPIEDEAPGPPLVQNMTSSASGSRLLSKK